jgi:diguanylate cyclase (GGDEF)-like protein
MSEKEKVYGSDSVAGVILDAANRARQNDQDLHIALQAAKRLEAVAQQRASNAEKAAQVAIEQSFVDQLTGCLNRNYFIKFAEESFDPIRDDGNLAIIYVDINDFKNINDALGHAEGDAILRSLSELLKTDSRKSGDTVVRLGGDEFAIICKKSSEGAQGADDAGTIFEDSLGVMMARMAKDAESMDPPISFSYGIAVYDKTIDQDAPRGIHNSAGLRGLQDVSLLNHTLIRADDNMYAHKSGRY